MGSSKKNKQLKKTRRGRRRLECIFKLIFDHIIHTDATDEPRHQRSSLAERLCELQPLTAVCHTWRQATLPLFYQSAVCSIKETPWTNGDHGHGSRSELVCNDKRQDPNYALRSNIDLIIGGSNEQYVRKLIIETRGDVTPDALVSVLSKSGFGSTKWLGVDKLRITHSYGNILRNPTYSTESISRLNLYLLHALPNLTSIKYSSTDDRRYYREFPLDGLLASMLSRLKEIKLASGLIPDMGSAAFLPGLVALTLRCPILADSAHLPMVFAETLEMLHVGFSSAGTIWSRFYNASTKQKLCFRRLKKLELEYMEPVDAKIKTSGEPKPASLYDDCYYASSESSSVYGGNTPVGAGSDSPVFDDDETLLDPDSPTRLMFYKQCEARKMWPSFPKLQSLSISNYPDAVSKILQHFSVDHILHISIRDVAQGWHSVNAASVAGLSSLRMHISPQGLGNKREEYRYQAWINRLFSVSSDMTSLQLTAPTSIPISLPDVIGLTHLSSLSFSFRIDLGTIPNLLSRLPHLQQMAVHVHPWSSWSHRSYGLLEYGDYEMLAHIPPLSRSLRSLVAYVGLEPISERDQSNDGSYGDEPMVVERELSWILARVPSLKLFKTEEWTGHAVCECIDNIMSYESIAPYVRHLSNIEMAVWKY